LGRSLGIGCCVYFDGAMLCMAVHEDCQMMSLATFSRILGKALGSPILVSQNCSTFNGYYNDYSVHVAYNLNTEAWTVLTTSTLQTRYTLAALLVFLPRIV